MSVYDIDGNVLDSVSQLTLDAKALGLHLMPANRGELNMVKRARQFTDILWTPSATIKRRNYAECNAANASTYGWQDVFLAGVTYKGIPYSHGYYNGAFRNYGMVGYQVSLDAFATSVQFADSYFSTEDVYNTTTSVYTPYGASCDTLGCYSMGLDTWYGSDGGYQTLVDNGTIILKFSGTDIASHIADIHLGDIMWKRAVHVAVITDVVIEDDGTVYIEVSEATTTGAGVAGEMGGEKGGVCRRELWSIPEFLIRFPSYNIYRYRDVEGVTYKQNAFVRLAGEGELHNVRSNIPLMPIMGHNFNYLSGHIPSTAILIKTNDYAYMAIIKDGSLFNTFSINNASYIQGGFSATGDYEAYLYNSTDGTIANTTNRSVSCKWKVSS